MRRPVTQFALAGLAVLAVFGAAAVLGLRSLAHDEALRDARQFAELAGQGIVEPTIEPALLDGDAAAIQSVDRVVNERVLGERVVRVKLWDGDGRIVYSDEPRLIGSSFPLDDAKRGVLRTGTTRAELSDLSGPENRFEKGLGELYEVYLPMRAPDGTPLLFETYQRRSEVAATGRRIWVPFAALLLASLVLLWLVQVPLAWRLGRRLQRTQEEREALLVHAVEASADEGAGSLPTSTTAPSRIWPGSRTPSARPPRRTARHEPAKPFVTAAAGHVARCAGCARCSSRSILRTCARAVSRPRSAISSLRFERAASRRSSRSSPTSA